MCIITLTKMTESLRIAEKVLFNLKRKYKNSSKLKKELRYFQNYVVKSDIFKGNRKKIYKMIKDFQK